MFQRVLAEERLFLNDDEYLYHYLGLTDRACFSAVYRANGRSISTEHLDALVARKSRHMLEALRTDIIVSDSVRSFVLDAAEHYRLAVASGALREEIELCLDRIGMLDIFEHITAAQDVLRGKPFPDPYVHCFAALASRQMIATDECLAIEDTPIGVQAAKAAGLYCVAIATTVVPDALTLADFVAPSLEKMDLGHVSHRLTGEVGRSPGRRTDQLWRRNVAIRRSPSSARAGKG